MEKRICWFVENEDLGKILTTVEDRGTQRRRTLPAAVNLAIAAEFESAMAHNEEHSVTVERRLLTDAELESLPDA